MVLKFQIFDEPQLLAAETISGLLCDISVASQIRHAACLVATTAQ